MGRITVRHPVTKLTVGADRVRRSDTLAVEEPLEIRVGGLPLAVTMRTPGTDVELAAGFLVSEGMISRGDQFRSAIHCGGPGSSRPISTLSIGAPAEGNTYNVLDVSLAPGVAPPDPELARAFYTTSSCGLCGKASIDAVETVSAYDVSDDAVRIDAGMLSGFPDALRTQQAVFDKTGGIHAAALFDATSGELLVLREDVGRHNAVDKVIGWAVLNDRLPLRRVVLQVSGRASFELVQKAVMAGIPILAAVSAPSSLAVELAAAAGLTLVGFLRGSSMNIYTRDDRIVDEGREIETAVERSTAVIG
jgi:FdhD protein